MPTRAFRFLHHAAEVERAGVWPPSRRGEASKEREGRSQGVREAGKWKKREDPQASCKLFTLVNAQVKT